VSKLKSKIDVVEIVDQGQDQEEIRVERAISTLESPRRRSEIGLSQYMLPSSLSLSTSNIKPINRREEMECPPLAMRRLFHYGTQKRLRPRSKDKLVS